MAAAELARAVPVLALFEDGAPALAMLDDEWSTGSPSSPGAFMDSALSDIAPLQDDASVGMVRRTSAPATSTASLPADTDLRVQDFQEYEYQQPIYDTGASADQESAFEADLTKLKSLPPAPALLFEPAPEPARASKRSASEPKCQPRKKGKARGGAGPRQHAAAVGLPEALCLEVAALDLREDPVATTSMLVVLETSALKMAFVNTCDRVVSATYVPKKTKKCGGQREPNDPAYRTYSWRKYISGQRDKYNDKWGPKPDKNAKNYLKSVTGTLERGGVFPVRVGTLLPIKWSELKKLDQDEPWAFRLEVTKCNDKTFKALHASLSGAAKGGQMDALSAYEVLPPSTLESSAMEDAAQEAEDMGNAFSAGDEEEDGAMIAAGSTSWAESCLCGTI